eukprot:10093523-Heterocapsa_arctica.AAC.1
MRQQETRESSSTRNQAATSSLKQGDGSEGQPEKLQKERATSRSEVMGEALEGETPQKCV